MIHVSINFHSTSKFLPSLVTFDFPDSYENVILEDLSLYHVAASVYKKAISSKHMDDPMVPKYNIQKCSE